MAVNLSEPGTVIPALHTQTKDPIAFKLFSTNTVAVAGFKAKIRLTVTGGVSALNTFEISSPLFGRKTWVFVPVAWLPQETGYAIPEYTSGSLSNYATLIAEYLRLNPYLSNYYNITTSGAQIFIEANEVGALYDLVWEGGTSSNLTHALLFQGEDKQFEPNMSLLYHVWGRTAGLGTYTLKSVSQARPDPDGWFTHDLHELIHGQTSFNLNPFTTGYLAERAFQWYVLVCENYGTPPDKKYVEQITAPDSFNFLSYRGGSSRVNTADFNNHAVLKKFLKRYNRAGQDMVRGTRGRYFISVINKAKFNLKLKVTWLKTDGSTGNYYAYDYLAPNDSGVYQFEISPRKIANDLTISDDELVRYNVEAEMDDVLTGQPYNVIVRDDDFDTRAFWFESSFGVTETIVCKGKYDMGIQVSKDEFRAMFPVIGANSTSRELYQKLNHFTETGTVFTGYMPIDDLRDFVIDLLISENVWTHGHSDAALLFRVYVDPESFSLFRRDDYLYGVSFSYKKTLIKQAHSNEA